MTQGCFWNLQLANPAQVVAVASVGNWISGSRSIMMEAEAWNSKRYSCLWLEENLILPSSWNPGSSFHKAPRPWADWMNGEIAASKEMPPSWFSSTRSKTCTAPTSPETVDFSHCLNWCKVGKAQVQHRPIEIKNHRVQRHALGCTRWLRMGYSDC